AVALSEDVNGIIQRANLDVGSPEPRADQDCRRKSPADQRTRTQAGASGRGAGMGKSGGGAAEGGSGTAEGGARVLSRPSSGVGATQPRGHRVGHPILLMGPEPGARTRQDRTRRRTPARVRSLVQKPGRHTEKTVAAPASLDRFGPVPCSSAGLAL